MKFTQQPHTLLMVRPASFGFNPQTGNSNIFQQMDLLAPEAVHEKVLVEFDTMVDLLASHEIAVRVFPDTNEPQKPDAVFPNNWITFHEDGHIILYPMMAENRRLERRMDIVETLKSEFSVDAVIDLSGEEITGRFLEGTGSMVFDHVHKLAYANRSERTNENLVRDLCKRIHYAPLMFDAVDENDRAIYHTNVMMCVGEKFALVCLDSIRDEGDQKLLLDSFSKTGHKVIAISYDQMHAFAGNMMEVLTKYGESIVLLSDTAYRCLLPGQLNAISKFSEVLPLRVPTIEKLGGGSVRCMIAGIHLPKRNTF